MVAMGAGGDNRLHHSTIITWLALIKIKIFKVSDKISTMHKFLWLSIVNFNLQVFIVLIKNPLYSRTLLVVMSFDRNS